VLTVTPGVSVTGMDDNAWLRCGRMQVIPTKATRRFVLMAGRCVRGQGQKPFAACRRRSPRTAIVRQISYLFTRITIRPWRKNDSMKLYITAWKRSELDGTIIRRSGDGRTSGRKVRRIAMPSTQVLGRQQPNSTGLMSA